MRKITITFNKLYVIQNLKTIIKKFHSNNSDHLPDIAKFHLGEKVFIPSQVEKAVSRITASCTDILEFPKTSLSFYLGTQHHFTKVAMTSEDEANYIILPWDFSSQVGRDNRKNLKNRIPSNVREQKYIIYVNNRNTPNSFDSSSNLSQSLT